MRPFVSSSKAIAFLVPFLMVCTSLGVAQSLSTQAAMHAQIVSVYNFSPSLVTAEVRSSKSNQMDAFWEEVKQNKNTELPLLRNELENRANPPFFLFDGSTLLLSLSQLPEDQKLAAVAISNTDLKDVQRRQYLYTVHGLAVRGIDVTSAALHMLDDPKFEVFLPEHGAYRLDQSSCLLVTLLPLNSDVWLPSVFERIKAKPDVTAMKTLMLQLFYAQTDEADTFLRSEASQEEPSKEIRDLAKMILEHERGLGVGKKPSPSTERRLREERRTRMFAVSDEAIDDMDKLTGEIAQARTPVARMH